MNTARASRRTVLTGVATVSAAAGASWYAVSGADQAIPPASQRAMASRAGSRTVEIAGASHAHFVTHPNVVVDLVRAAARATAA